MNSEEEVNNYIKSEIFLQYSEKKSQEPKEDDFFSRINFSKKKKENQKNVENETETKKSPIISETLNNMFPPKKFEENGHKYIQYVSPTPATRDKSRDLYKA